MIDKKKNIKIKYQSKEKLLFIKKQKEKYAELSTTSSTNGFEEIPNYLAHWFEKRYKFNKAKVNLAVDDFVKAFLEYPDFNLERIKEIEKMDLQDEPEYDEDDFGSDYKDKIYISTSVSKKKIAGKDSFVVRLNNLPTDEEIENHTNGEKNISKNLHL